MVVRSQPPKALEGQVPCVIQILASEPSWTHSDKELPPDLSGNLWHFSPFSLLFPVPGLTHLSLGLAGRPGSWLPFAIHSQSEGTTFQVGAGGSEGQDSEGKAIAINIS